MNKKIIALLSFLILASPCFANPSGSGSSRLASFKPGTAHFDSSQVLSSIGQTAGRLDYVGLTSSPSLIYSITLTATASNAKLAIFDSAISEYVEPVWEMSVSTSGNSTTINFGNSPIPTYNGISITVQNGTADIAYE